MSNTESEVKVNPATSDTPPVEQQPPAEQSQQAPPAEQQKPAEQSQKPAESLNIISILANFQKETELLVQQNKQLKEELNKAQEALKAMNEYEKEKQNLVEKIKELELAKEQFLNNPFTITGEQKRRYMEVMSKLPKVPKTYLYDTIELIECSETRQYFIKCSCVKTKNTNCFVIPIRKESFAALSETNITKIRTDMSRIVPADFAEVRLGHHSSDNDENFRLTFYGKFDQRFYGCSDVLAKFPFPLDKVPAGAL